MGYGVLRLGIRDTLRSSQEFRLFELLGTFQALQFALPPCTDIDFLIDEKLWLLANSLSLRLSSLEDSLDYLDAFVSLTESHNNPIDWCRCYYHRITGVSSNQTQCW